MPEQKTVEYKQNCQNENPISLGNLGGLPDGITLGALTHMDKFLDDAKRRGVWMSVPAHPRRPFIDRRYSP